MASTQVAIIGNGIIGIIDEVKYDIVVPLTTSVELYQFFPSDVVIFVEKSNDDYVLLLSSHGNCSARFTNNISSKYATLRLSRGEFGAVLEI